MIDNNSVNYCGSCCRECALSTGFTALREAAKALNELIEIHGMQNWIPRAWLPEAENKFDFTEFRKGLAFFSNKESFFVCRKRCKDGGGFAECIMRKCCLERRLDVCYDCGDFPCNKVQWNPIMIKRASEYKKLGRDKWLRQEKNKAKKGFELYAGKYYQVRTGKTSPE